MILAHASITDGKDFNVRETVVRCALVQTHSSPEKEETVQRQVGLIHRAAQQGAQIVCLQELSFGPYICQTREDHWFGWAEEIPDGPTTQGMRELARETRIVLVVPLFERENDLYYNTAAVIDADGGYLGKYRKLHIPETENFWEKYYFRPGNLGCPVFATRYAEIGVYICYDRHFPEGARLLGLQGAEIVFIPTATAGPTKALWMVESRAHAIANGYYVGSVNRVGIEQHPDIQFFGSSYFCDPWGYVIAQGSDTEDEVVIADLDLSKLRPHPYYFTDRRIDAYGPLTDAPSVAGPAMVSGGA